MATVDIGILQRVFKVTFRFSLRNQQIQTGFNLGDVGLSNETAQTTLDDVVGFYAAKMRQALSNEINLQRISVERWLDGDYAAQEFVNQPGTLGLSMQSTFLALAISVRSGSRLRIANGRFFWPAAGSWANDTIAGSGLATATQMVADMSDRYLGNPLFDRWHIGTVHRPKKDNAGQPIGVHKYTEATTLRLNPLVTTVRSRKVGVGR